MTSRIHTHIFRNRHLSITCVPGMYFILSYTTFLPLLYFMIDFYDARTNWNESSSRYVQLSFCSCFL